MIELRVLGGLDLHDAADGRVLRSILTRTKRAALLVRLALAAPGGYERRDTLMGLFWPESDDERARHALSQALYVLRRGLGRNAVVGRGDDEVGIDPDRVWCDAVAFERALDDGDPETALELYSGDLLPGYFLDDCPGFERWLDGERRRLRDRAVAAAAELAERYEAEGNAPEAVRWARKAAELAPLSEPVGRALIALLARVGDPSGGLAEYERLAARLRQELEVEPSPETAAVAAGLREGQGGGMTAGSAGAAEAGTIGPVESVEVARSPDGPGSDAVPIVPGGGRAPVGAGLGRRPGHLAAAAVALAMVAAAIVLTFGGGPEPPPREGEADVRVAVLPFTVRGDDRYAYLSAGVVDLLSDNLDLPGELRAVDPRVVLAEVRRRSPDPVRGARLADRLRATHFVLGTIVAAGERLEMTATLYAADGTPVARAEAGAASEAEVFGALDRLSRELVAGHSAGLGDPLAATAARTSASVEALRAYLEGEDAFRAGRYNGAVAAFERAVAADSGFAMAYFRLGVAADWAGRSAVSHAALDRAWSLRDRLPERARLLLEGTRNRGHAERARRIFRRVVTRYPDAVEGWAELADVLFHGNDWPTQPGEVREAFHRVLEYDPGNPAALLHLARLEAWSRDPVALDSLVARALALGAADLQALELRALRAFALGDEAERAGAVRDLRALDDATLEWMVGRTVLYSGEYRATRPAAELLVEPRRSEELRVAGHILLAFMDAAGGRFEVAFERIDALAAIDPDAAVVARAALLARPTVPADTAALRRARDALLAIEGRAERPAVGTLVNLFAGTDGRAYALGLLSARLGDVDAALQHAAWLEANPGNRRAAQRADIVRAVVHLIEGRPDAALDALGTEGMGTTPDATRLGAFLRGEALHRLGREGQALAWFGSVVGGAPLAILHDAPNRLRMARILDARGEAAPAAEQYRRFLELWRDADPAVAEEVRDAQTRLAALDSG